MNNILGCEHKVMCLLVISYYRIKYGRRNVILYDYAYCCGTSVLGIILSIKNAPLAVK